MDRYGLVAENLQMFRALRSQGQFSLRAAAKDRLPAGGFHPSARGSPGAQEPHFCTSVHVSAEILSQAQGAVGGFVCSILPLGDMLGSLDRSFCGLFSRWGFRSFGNLKTVAPCGSRCLALLAQPFSRPSQGRTLFLGLASLALAFLLLMISGTHFNLQEPTSENVDH